MEYAELKQRAKMFWVSPEMFMMVLHNWQRNDAVCLPKMKDLEGAYLDDVHYDFSMRAFACRVVHPDWPICPENRLLDIIEPEVEIVEIPRPKKGKLKGGA